MRDMNDDSNASSPAMPSIKQSNKKENGIQSNPTKRKHEDMDDNGDDNGTVYHFFSLSLFVFLYS